MYVPGITVSGPQVTDYIIRSLMEVYQSSQGVGGGGGCGGRVEEGDFFHGYVGSEST